MAHSYPLTPALTKALRGPGAHGLGVVHFTDERIYGATWSLDAPGLDPPKEVCVSGAELAKALMGAGAFVLVFGGMTVMVKKEEKDHATAITLPASAVQLPRASPEPPTVFKPFDAMPEMVALAKRFGADIVFGNGTRVTKFGKEEFTYFTSQQTVYGTSSARTAPAVLEKALFLGVTEWARNADGLFGKGPGVSFSV